MDGPRDYHTEGSKSERKGEIAYDIPHMQNLKIKDTKELPYKTKTDSQTYRINLWLPREGYG